jgi:hypothetical protein
MRLAGDTTVVEDAAVSTARDPAPSEHAAPITRPAAHATIQSERKTFSPVREPAAYSAGVPCHVRVTLWERRTPERACDT